MDANSELDSRSSAVLPSVSDSRLTQRILTERDRVGLGGEPTALADRGGSWLWKTTPLSPRPFTPTPIILPLHHFAIQAPLMILPLGSVPCLVRIAPSPSGSRQTPPSVEGKIMVGKMMVRRPDGHGTSVFVFEVRLVGGAPSVARVLLGHHFYAPLAVRARR